MMPVSSLPQAGIASLFAFILVFSHLAHGMEAVPPGALSFKDPTGDVYAYFDQEGNFCIDGTIKTNEADVSDTLNQTAGTVTIKNASGEVVAAIVNTTPGQHNAELLLEGSLRDRTTLYPTPFEPATEITVTKPSFVVKDRWGRIVSFIDEDGNMVLSGVASTSTFRRIIIGDIDGFGWKDGSLLPAGVTSSTMDYDGNPYPVNSDGAFILGVGDFLPDMDGDGTVGQRINSEGEGEGEGEGETAWPPEAGDNWDNRDGELTSSYITGFVDRTGTLACDGAQYTDISLSNSFCQAAPYLYGPLDFTCGDCEDPGTLEDCSCGLTGQNYPGEPCGYGNLNPEGIFLFQFTIPKDGFPFELDVNDNIVAGQEIFANIVVGDLDSSSMRVNFEFHDYPASSGAYETLIPNGQAVTRDGTVTLITKALPVDRVFQKQTSGGGPPVYFGYLNISITKSPLSSGRTPFLEPYVVFDYAELSVDRRDPLVISFPDDLISSEGEGEGEGEGEPAGPTIQDAIDLARDGTTVLLPGNETFELDVSLILGGKNIRLVGQQDTVIDGSNLNNTSAIQLQNNFYPTTQILGLELVNCSSLYGGAIFGSNTVDAHPLPVLVEHCFFENNQALGGAAIQDIGLIYQCEFEDNISHGAYGGAVSGAAVVANCRFQGNSNASGGTPGAACIHYTNDDIAIVHNNFIDNFGGPTIGPYNDNTSGRAWNSVFVGNPADDPTEMIDWHQYCLIESSLCEHLPDCNLCENQGCGLDVDDVVVPYIAYEDSAFVEGECDHFYPQLLDTCSTQSCANEIDPNTGLTVQCTYTTEHILGYKKCDRCEPKLINTNVLGARTVPVELPPYNDTCQPLYEHDSVSFFYFIGGDNIWGVDRGAGDQSGLPIRVTEDLNGIPLEFILAERDIGCYQVGDVSSADWCGLLNE